MKQKKRKQSPRAQALTACNTLITLISEGKLTMQDWNHLCRHIEIAFATKALHKVSDVVKDGLEELKEAEKK